MATMIDPKPEFKGEAKAWGSMKDFLPDSVIAYNNREIDGREFDLCLFIENCGIVVIEIKGWLADKISVRGVDNIEVEGYETPQRSPKKQARAYRFALLNRIIEKYSASPLVFDMVCYPFITKSDYYLARLDIVSEERSTLFKEDLEDKTLLLKKIQDAYLQYAKIPHANLDAELIARLRQDWEPDYATANNTPEKNAQPYSILSVYPQQLTQADASEIVDEYFAGIKRILFVSSEKDHGLLVEEFDNAFKRKGIQPGVSHLALKYERPLVKTGACTRVFNLEIHQTPKIEEIVNQPFCVSEGHCAPQQRDVLIRLGKHTSFNYQQYCVEHASTETNTLVEAGAGTGKTYSMVSRVAYLCNKASSRVSNLADEIAMVTFTNDAATNMKVRLKQLFVNYFILTGDPRHLKNVEDVDRAKISTIHSFVIEQLREEVLYSGLGTNFRIASNEFLRGRIYDDLLNAYIEKKEQESDEFIREMPVPVFELRKKLMAIADRLLAKSVDLDGIVPSQMGIPANGFMPCFNELIEAVLIPAEIQYAENMNLSNDLDLKESIIRFGKVLDRHEGPLRSLRVRHLFIDEFQDTDDAQIRVFSMLQKAINEQCRLFIVGDLKQSIYRFRGATLSAFQQIEQMSKFGWEKYSLTINYRTDSRLLDQFHSVFEKMGENDFLPYCEADRLTSSVFVEKTEDDLFACIPCHANDEEEFGETLLKVLSKQISLLNGLITQREIRGEKPLSKAERTIAVLVRSNWQVDRIVSLGKRNGISIETKSGGDLFQLTPTQDLYKLLIALENSSNPVYLANLIESNLVGLELDYSTLRDLPLSECAKELIEVLDNFFEDRMGKTWQEVVNSAYAEPILFAIKQMYDSLRPWKNYSEKIPGQRHYKINYECLVETIAQSAKADTLTLNQIANYLKVSIVTQQERPSRELDFGDKEIEILCTTVHKSKGLEYGTVILPYTSAEIGSAAKIKLDANYVDSKLAYIATFENGAQEYNSNFDLLAETSEQVSEESRVLYVALTRAIRNFVWVKNLDSKAAISWGVLLEA